MSSPGAFPASLFHMPESGEEETTTVISGRRCSGLLAKSGPLGSLVRTLLESPLWWKEGYYLTWEAIPLSSRKVTTFTDTNLTNPLPSNESAETLSVSDIPSSRCLFRLRLSAHPTGETESSSSPLMLTPTSVMYSDTPEEMQARKKRNGYRNGTKYVNLETQLKYDPKYASMLPTPQAMDGTDVRSIMGKNDVLVETPSGLRRVVQTGSDFGVSLGFLANNKMLPTPTVIQGGPNKIKDGKRVYHEDKKGGGFSAQLHDLAVAGLLPTPTARDEKNPSSPNGARIARKMEQGYTIELNDLAAMEMLPTPRANNMTDCVLTNPKMADEKGGRLEGVIASRIASSSQKTDGASFRLSPLFTEEMMGFPLMWTALPFLQCQDLLHTEKETRKDTLSPSGEPNPSKPTEMQ